MTYMKLVFALSAVAGMLALVIPELASAQCGSPPDCVTSEPPPSDGSTATSLGRKSKATSSTTADGNGGGGNGAIPTDCSAPAIAAVVRAGKGKPAKGDAETLTAFLRSPDADVTPNLTASALAALWLSSPDQAGDLYFEEAARFRAAQATIAERGGLVATPCLSKGQFMPLWSKVKPRWEKALASDDLSKALPPGPYVTLYARYTRFQMNDPSAVRLVDQRVHAALERSGNTSLGPKNGSSSAAALGDECDTANCIKP